MRLAINSDGQLMIKAPPSSVVPRLQHWFRVRQVDAHSWLLPHRKVFAFVARYSSVRIDPDVVTWLRREFTYDAVLHRVRPELKRWRGGYEARIVAEALSSRMTNPDPRAPVESRLSIYGEYGCGKTIIFCEIARLTGPTLIITPRGVWADAYVSDVARKDGSPEGDLVRLYGPDAPPAYRLRWSEAMDPKNKEARVAAMRCEADIYAVSSDVVGKMLPEILDLPLATIIVEEGYKMANPNSELARACRTLYPHVPNRFTGSGNPAPRDPVQFHEQVEFCEQGLLPPRKEFVSLYSKKRGARVEFASAERKAEALQLVRGCVRMVGRDEYWPDRPPVRDIIMPVELGPVQRAAYDSMREDLRLSFGDHEELIANSPMARVMKLRELTAGFVYDRRKNAIPIGEQVKLKRLARMVRSNRYVGHCQAVLWCHWQYEYEQVARLLSDHGKRFGSYLGNDRDSYRARDRFKSRRIQYLISNPQTAGHGLRLHNSSRAVYMSIGNDPDPFDQSRGRVWRPPQQFPCLFFFLLARNTIDYDLWEVQTGAMDWQTCVRRALAPPEPSATDHEPRQPRGGSARGERASAAHRAERRDTRTA